MAQDELLSQWVIFFIRWHTVALDEADGDYNDQTRVATQVDIYASNASNRPGTPSGPLGCIDDDHATGPRPHDIVANNDDFFFGWQLQQSAYKSHSYLHAQPKRRTTVHRRYGISLWNFTGFAFSLKVQGVNCSWHRILIFSSLAYITTWRKHNGMYLKCLLCDSIHSSDP